MATEEWIQESLARLESLEEERKRHEDALESGTDPSTLRMHTQAVERLEVKIRALYAELEAVAAQDADSGDDGDAADDADDDDGGDGDDDADDDSNDDVVAAAPARPASAPVRAAPAPTPASFASAPAASPFASAPAASPFGAPAASPFGDAPAASPFSSAPAASPFGSAPSESAFSTSPGASFDGGDSDSEGGSGSKMGLIIGLVVVLGGAGAYFALGRKPVEEAPPPPPPTELKVIKSGEVPPDTQGPRTAKGGNIDATHGAEIKESERRAGGGGGGSSSPPSDKPEKKKDDKLTKIEKTDDPLAGIR